MSDKSLSGLSYTKAALSGLQEVDPPNRRRAVEKKVRGLLDDAQPQGARRLTNVEHHGHPIYRLRLGDYRVLYSVLDGPRIVILDIGHGKDIYRGLS